MSSDGGTASSPDGGQPPLNAPDDWNPKYRLAVCEGLRFGWMLGEDRGYTEKVGGAETPADAPKLKILPKFDSTLELKGYLYGYKMGYYLGAREGSHQRQFILSVKKNIAGSGNPDSDALFRSKEYRDKFDQFVLKYCPISPSPIPIPPPIDVSSLLPPGAPTSELGAVTATLGMSGSTDDSELATNMAEALSLAAADAQELSGHSDAGTDAPPTNGEGDDYAGFAASSAVGAAAAAFQATNFAKGADAAQAQGNPTLAAELRQAAKMYAKAAQDAAQKASAFANQATEYTDEASLAVEDANEVASDAMNAVEGTQTTGGAGTPSV